MGFKTFCVPLSGFRKSGEAVICYVCLQIWKMDMEVRACSQS
jgi:hypothetical protein